MKIIIGTQNQDKLKELQNGLEDLNLNLISLKEFPKIEEIIEDGETLKENALIKARYVFNYTGIPTISDDTGLEVDALNGAPGVFTARFAGENCSYDDNVNKMLKEMQSIPIKKRQAKFRTVMAFVSKNMELTTEGSVEGIIALDKKGLAGFGYDPIFYVQDKGKTFAEMSTEEKNIISHRGRAIMSLKAKLRLHLNNIIQENA